MELCRWLYVDTATENSLVHTTNYMYSTNQPWTCTNYRDGIEQMAYRPYNLDCLWYVLYIWWLKTAVSEHQVGDIIKFAPYILYFIGNKWFCHCWHVTASSKYRPCIITDCSDFETFYICLSKKSFVFWPIFHSLKFILTFFASEAIRWGFLRMMAYITLFYIL